jgi:hypothetical protein
MSIQSNFPAVKPSLLLDFANTKQLDNRITFTRSTPAVYYDGETTAMAEQNLITYSQEFGTWPIARATVTGNTTVAPDGTTTADTITQTSTGVYGTPYKQITTVAAIYTQSIYAKAGTASWLLLGDENSGKEAWFNISAGTVGTVTSGTTATITSAGSGWYLCTVTYTLAAVVGTFINAVANGDNSTTGTGGTTIILWGAQLEQRSTATAYTATTTQAITNYIPVLLSAGGNQARFDHNPTTGESLGLLIEEQRTNQITNSTTFNSQTVTNCTVYSNTIIAPDGTLTGSMIQDDSTNGQHGLLRTYSVTSGTLYRSSVYLKMGTQRYVSLSYPSATSTRLWATFDLLNGTVTGSWGDLGTITPVGNGWYRISGAETAGATASAYLELQFNSTGVNPSWPSTTQPAAYAGIGSYFYAWGMQGEAGAFASSYIATTSASATRTADAASMTGANFSSWFNAAEGTFYINADRTKYSGSNGYLGVTADSNNASDQITFDQTNSTSLRAFYMKGYPSTGYPNFTSTNIGTTFKAALAYKSGDTARVVDAVTAATSSDSYAPSANFSIMRIGNQPSGTLSINTTIKKISYYPLRLSNTNIQALTS